MVIYRCYEPENRQCPEAGIRKYTDMEGYCKEPGPNCLAVPAAIPPGSNYSTLTSWPRMLPIQCIGTYVRIFEYMRRQVEAKITRQYVAAVKDIMDEYGLGVWASDIEDILRKYTSESPPPIPANSGHADILIADEIDNAESEAE